MNCDDDEVNHDDDEMVYRDDDDDDLIWSSEDSIYDRTIDFSFSGVLKAIESGLTHDLAKHLATITDRKAFLKCLISRTPKYTAAVYLQLLHGDNDESIDDEKSSQEYDGEESQISSQEYDGDESQDAGQNVDGDECPDDDGDEVSTNNEACAASDDDNDELMDDVIDEDRNHRLTTPGGRPKKPCPLCDKMVVMCLVILWEEYMECLNQAWANFCKTRRLLQQPKMRGLSRTVQSQVALRDFNG